LFQKLVSSTVRALAPAGDVYAATINDSIAVKIGRGDWSPNMAKIEAKGGQAWLRACSGHNWACWEIGQK
jgi:alpha-amylase